MNRFVSMAALLLIVNFANAQFSVGLRGGLNFTSLPEKSYAVNNDQIVALPDNYSGFHVGVVSQLRFLGAFIQPELLFVSTGTQMKYVHGGDDPDAFFHQRFSRLDVPVLLGLKTGPLRLGLGPVASVVLDNSSNLLSAEKYKGDENLRQRFNSATYGYQLGVGLNVGNLLFDLKYEGSLSNLSEEITIGNTTFPFNTRPRQFIFSIGLLFF